MVCCFLARVDGCCVDPSIRLLEAPCAIARQPVQTLSANGRCCEPAFAGETENAGTNQSLVDVESRKELDQPGEHHGAAVRSDGIAPHGDDQRWSARRRVGELAPDPASDVRVGERVAIGFAHGGGKGSEHDT